MAVTVKELREFLRGKSANAAVGIEEGELVVECKDEYESLDIGTLGAEDDGDDEDDEYPGVAEPGLVQ